MTAQTIAQKATPRLDRVGAACLVVGGIAFLAYGPMHPRGTDEGDKLEQLHSMLVESLWYPAHAVAIAAFALITAGILGIRRRASTTPSMARLVTGVSVVSVIATLGSVVHLFAATQAAATGRGESTALVKLFIGVETVVNPVWGLAIAALAVAGGLTGAVGNRFVLALGLLGGVVFALFNATIASTDLFDAIAPGMALIGVWAAAVGVSGLRHP